MVVYKGMVLSHGAEYLWGGLGAGHRGVLWNEIPHRDRISPNVVRLFTAQTMHWFNNYTPCR
jgi:hypothetical protein